MKDNADLLLHRAEATFDVLVVGAGHAGTEAAVAAARLGASVGLVTSALETIGQMSCNPAIGGVAKGTVVREVDALGGIMARATDLAMLQFRMLNQGKGPAVWAPRAQCDRGLYRRAVRSLVEEHSGIHTIQGTVARLLLDDNGRRVAGLETLEGRRFAARAVVLTTGTFGRGTIHIGTTTQIAGGRAGESASVHLGQQLDAVGLTTHRFKTGTPPRIDGRSVRLDALQLQPSEVELYDWSWSHFWEAPRREAAHTREYTPVQTLQHSLERTPAQAPTRTRHPEQLPCWITYLEDAGKQIIARHIGESAMYGGAIASQGPRYCPSVEDKIVKFPHAERHQLFLEPEGHDTHELYVNGLSTSLPAPVQLAVLRSIPGLEQVRVTRAGYAIEYDYYPPTQLDASLQSRAIAGLWCAGQVNGTTGYEEAAGQGVVAGLNAARWVQERDPVILGRESSYIGVLVDDLVTRGVDEPYRLFTSRSEFRLTVRQDNALQRLSPIGESLSLYTERELVRIAQRRVAEAEALQLAQTTSIRPEQAVDALAGSGTAPLAHAVKIADVAKRQGVSLSALFTAVGVGSHLDRNAVVSAELELKYAAYFDKERRAADRLRSLGRLPLPAELDYLALRTLSMEARQKLDARRPETLAQAQSIPGISPSDIQNLVIELERRRRVASAGGGDPVKVG